MAIDFEKARAQAKALSAAARTGGLESKTADSTLKSQERSTLPAGSTVSYTNVTTPSTDSLTADYMAARKAEDEAWNAYNQYTNSTHFTQIDQNVLDSLNQNIMNTTKAREAAEEALKSADALAYNNAYSEAKYANATGAEATGVGKGIMSIGKTLTSAPGVIAETAKSAIKGEDIDMSSDAMRNMGEAIYLKNAATENAGSVGKFLGNTALSIGQNMALLPMNAAVPGSSLVAMGAISAADKMYELGAQGTGAKEALLRGAVSGAIEGLTEKLPLDTLSAMIKSGGKSVAKNLLKQAGVEATEEGVSYFANWVADKLAKDPNATWSWDEFTQSVASGGLSGLFFGLGGTVIGGVNGETAENPENRPTTPTNDVTATTTPSEQKTAPNAVNGAEAVDVENGVAPATGEATAVSQLRSAGSEGSVPPTNTVTNENENVKQIVDSMLADKKSDKSVSNILNTILATQNDNPGKEKLFDAFSALFEGNEYGVNANGVLRKTDAENHIDNRSFSSVGDTRIPSFQYDNPSLHNFFVDAAGMMQEDLAWSTKGERFIVGDAEDYGSTKKWAGTKRSTTPEIVSLKDDARLTYAELDKALENIIADKGQENYAAAKRVEIVLDQMLTNGYKNIRGEWVEPNQEYIEAKSKIPGASPVTEVEADNDPLPLYNEQERREMGYTESVGAAPSGFDPYSNMIAEYGIIPEGENPARMVDLPKSTTGEDRVSYSARTVMEAQATPDAMLGDIADAVLSGKLSHEVNTDEAAMERARAIVEDKGWEGVLENFHQMARKGIVSKDAVALGQVLLNNAMNSGDSKAVISLLVDYSSMSTTAAQSLQAQRMLKKLTPEGQLYGIQRSVQNLQEELTERYKDKAPNLEIPEELLQNFLNAQDQDARDSATVEIYKNIASQVPSTWMDKWNAWRYMSMLTNPRTHVRNIVGNLGFAPVRMVKNAVATTLESGINLVAPNMQRTKAALNVANANDRALISAAFKDVANVQEQLLGAGKYAESGSSVIEENRRIFNNPILELVRKGNSAAMEKEDSWFSSPAYAGALAGYLKANGVTAEAFTNGTVDASLLDDARSYAIKEAQKATYRDHNAFSDFISKLHYKGDNKVGQAFDKLVEGVLPFRRTPANILVRGLEYSPARLLKGLTYDLAQVARGNKTAAEAIDGISAGLTGTGLLALGAYLASQGLLSGGDTGEEERDAMADLTGGQNYALNVGGKNLTLDWLAPEALPFFVGVELFNTMSENSSEGVTLDGVLSSLNRIADPMLEMSMLSGIQDLIDTVQYAESGTLPKVIANAAVSYLTQAIPTLFGQIERSTESQRESTFIDRTSGVPRDIQYTIGKAANKLPGEFQQIPYIDAWGRTEETGNAVERILNNFLNPSYVSEENTTKTDKEINRLIDAGFTGVAPDRVSQSQKVDGEYMDAKQYTEYATVKGQTSFDLVSDMILSTVYKGMTDEEKAEAIAKAYSYAGHVAAEEITNGKHESEKYVELAQDAQKDLGLSEAEYLLYYMKYGGTIMNGDAIREAYDMGIDVEDYAEFAAGKSKYDANGNSSYTNAENLKAVEESGFTGDALTALYMITFPDWVNSAAKKGVDFMRYVEYKKVTNGLESDKDANGETIRGSLKKKKIAALIAAGYNSVQANQMYKEME